VAKLCLFGGPHHLARVSQRLTATWKTTRVEQLLS
jgi:hypothetical protein